MANYWVVVGEGNSDDLSIKLGKRVKASLQQGQPMISFEVPQGDNAPKFGSFDNLIRFTDDLQKHDAATEGVLRRIERQWVELDDETNKADFQVNGESVSAFLKKNWQWDETKFPSSNSLQANLDFLLGAVNKLDEQLRSNAQGHSDIKSQKTAVSKRDAATFPTRELIDLLIPSAVDKNDFVETKHLTTVIVILARGQEKDFENWYEQPTFVIKKTVEGEESEMTDSIPLPKTVIPGSAKQFTGFQEGAADKDGNTVWRVVLFKACKDKFVTLARQNKFIVRDFNFSEAEFAALGVKRDQLDLASDKSLIHLREFSKKAWADVFGAWLHLKSMRAFVEATLRYGQAKNGYAGFILCPKAGAQAKLREQIASALVEGKANVNASASAADADGEEFFPYVSLTFAPRAAVQ